MEHAQGAISCTFLANSRFMLSDYKSPSTVLCFEACSALVEMENQKGICNPYPHVGQSKSYACHLGQHKSYDGLEIPQKCCMTLMHLPWWRG